MSFAGGTRGFVVGLLAGVLLAVGTVALAEEEEPVSGLEQSVLYAIAALAQDTERNATSIVVLRQRIEDLELQLAEIVEEQN